MDQMEKAPIPSGNQPFTVIDLGTADGGTVMVRSLVFYLPMTPQLWTTKHSSPCSIS